VAADDKTCLRCGKPLEGRDRFEGLCASCREKEVLGEPPPEDEEPAEPGGVTCPACGADNPVGVEHCIACEATLRSRGTAVWVSAAIAVAALAVVGVVVLAWPWLRPAPRGPIGPTPRGGRPLPLGEQPAPGPPAPSSAEAPPATAVRARPRPDLIPRVREETKVLLDLLRQRAYARVIDNYCQPDEAAFRRTERLLDAMLHGKAKPGLLRWTTRLTRLDEVMAREELREAGDPHPDYTIALLTHLVRHPEASGRHRSAEDRARSLLAWHLAGLFEGLELAAAEIRAVQAEGGGRFVVELDCGGTPRGPRPGEDPRRLRWARRPVGWVLELALDERLADVHALLTRPAP